MIFGLILMKSGNGVYRNNFQLEIKYNPLGQRSTRRLGGDVPVKWQHCGRAVSGRWARTGTPMRRPLHKRFTKLVAIGSVLCQVVQKNNFYKKNTECCAEPPGVFLITPQRVHDNYNLS